MLTTMLTHRGHHSLLRTRLDPIVSPGKVAGHVHMFSGSSAISHTMDHDKAVNAPCTSNKMSADMSGCVFTSSLTCSEGRFSDDRLCGGGGCSQHGCH